MKVLLALDRSGASQHAARVASSMLAPAHAEFVVVSVAELPVAWPVGVGAATPLDLPTMAPAHQRAEEAVIADEAETAGVADAEVEVVVGNVVAEISEAAERHDVDLIVVGSHHRSLLHRLLEPSVARGVVREAVRPVLVVPDPAS